MDTEWMPIIPDVEVYTENEFGHNIKPREVYCENCKYRTITRLAGPKCGTCRGNMINVPRCNFKQVRDELA